MCSLASVDDHLSQKVIRRGSFGYSRSTTRTEICFIIDVSCFNHQSVIGRDEIRTHDARYSCDQQEDAGSQHDVLGGEQDVEETC